MGTAPNQIICAPRSAEARGGRAGPAWGDPLDRPRGQRKNTEAAARAACRPLVPARVSTLPATETQSKLQNQTTSMSTRVRGRISATYSDAASELMVTKSSPIVTDTTRTARQGSRPTVKSPRRQLTCDLTGPHGGTPTRHPACA